MQPISPIDLSYHHHHHHSSLSTNLSSPQEQFRTLLNNTINNNNTNNNNNYSTTEVITTNKRSKTTIPNLLFYRNISYPSSSYYTKQITTHPSLIKKLYIFQTLNDNKKGHKGCVNTISWIPANESFASSNISLFNCPKEHLLISKRISTPHTGNVFHCKWFPNCNLENFVSCAADSKVCIFKNFKNFQTINEHDGMVHRLCIDSENTFITSSQDGTCKLFDLRNCRGGNSFNTNSSALGTLLVKLRNNNNTTTTSYNANASSTLDINSIDLNPMNENEFILGCGDCYIRLFDKRFINNCSQPVRMYCPQHLHSLDSDSNNTTTTNSGNRNSRRSNSFPVHVTNARFNKFGNEIVGTYSGDCIYLFDKENGQSHSQSHNQSINRTTNDNHNEIQFEKQIYKGHRNIRTVKEVNFYGEYSEYIISGSDCGHLFIWNKQTSEIINIIKGDKHVINCLAPHPFQNNLLATSGIEYDIKCYDIGTFKEEEEFNLNLKEKVKNELIEENEKKTREGHSSILLPASIVFNLVGLMNENQNQEEREERRRRVRQLLEQLYQEEEEEDVQQEQQENNNNEMDEEDNEGDNEEGEGGTGGGGQVGCRTM
ncbi:hypothetical protein ABK040_002783 [Willaertia magna]